MKCVNCDSDALYIYETYSTHPQAYCLKCLPSFLKDSVRKGLLKTTEAFEAAKQQALKSLAPEKPAKASKKAAAEASVEVPVEAPAVEEPVADTLSPEEAPAE
jgi:hypothetical protein